MWFGKRLQSIWTGTQRCRSNNRVTSNMGATDRPTKQPGAPESDDASEGDKSGAQPPAAHLRADWPNPAARDKSYDPDGVREWVCDDCGRRVTRSLRHPTEYGHGPKCEHGIDHSRATYGGETDA